jgi:hypothetical protein
MKVWNSKNMIKLQNQEVYYKEEYLAEKVDRACYEIIYYWGRVHMDTSFEYLKNIEGLLENIEAFSAYESESIICIYLYHYIKTSDSYDTVHRAI